MRLSIERSVEVRACECAHHFDFDGHLVEEVWWGVWDEDRGDWASAPFEFRTRGEAAAFKAVAEERAAVQLEECPMRDK